MGRGRFDRTPVPRTVAGRQPHSAVARPLLERGRKLDLDKRLAAEPPHVGGPEAAVGQHTHRLVLELAERPQAVRSHELLAGGEAVDALLRVDDEDPVRLVDAVHRADVHAGLVFDVDTGLGDDVRHAATLPKPSARRRQLVDELPRALDERGLHHHLVEPGGVGGSQTGRVRVVRVAENGDVRERVRDLFGLAAGDVHDHEIRRIGVVDRDEVMLRQERLELPPEEQVDPTEQDRRHCRKVRAHG